MSSLKNSSRHSETGKALPGLGFRGFLLFLLAGFLCFPLLGGGGAGLAAEPILKIQGADAGRFPTLSIRARFNPLDRSVVIRKEDFELYEIHRGREFLLPIKDFQGPGEKVEGLDLVFLFDTTVSLAPRDFKRAKRLLRGIFDRLKKGDRTAFYTLTSRAELRAGFTSDKKKLRTALAGIRRRGRGTRVFDSLQTGLRAARNGSPENQDGEKLSRRPAALFLITDGRDEGSFLNAEDGAVLAGLGRKMRIPVHVILHGRAKNKRPLKRLSLLTEGAFQKGLSLKTVLADLRRLRESPPRTYFFLTESEAARRGMIMPGDKPALRLVWKTPRADEEAHARYVTSWETMLEFYSRSFPLWLIFLLGALFMLALLIFLLKVFGVSPRRDAIARTETSARIDTDPEIQEDEDPRDEFIEEFGEKKGALASVTASPVSGLRAPGGPTPERNTAQLRAALQRDPKTAFLDAHFYRQLESALAEATPYSEASLRLPGRLSESRRESFTLFLDSSALGRSSEADIRLDDPSLAPLHARIRRVDGKYVLYDLASPSGTYLNGRRLLRPRALRDGDEVRVGRSLISFRGRK